MSHRTLVIILLLWALLIPLVYLGPVSLTRYAPGALPIVLVATGFSLLVVGLYARTRILEDAARIPRVVIPYLLSLVIIFYVAVSFHISRQNFLSFSSHLPQLGIFSQSVWTTLHGHLFANTHETVDGSLASHFGIHFSPTLLLLVPLYAAWPSPLMLMLVQALVVGLTIVPFYLLLIRQTGNAGALVLASGLLALPAMAWAGCNDFHDATFLPVLLITAILGAETRRRWLFVAAVLTALGVREDTGLIVAMLGVYIGLRGLGWRNGAVVSGFGLAWFLLSVRWIMPHFWSPGLWMDPARFFTLHLRQWGETPSAVLSYIVSHPLDSIREAITQNKLHYVYALLQPTLFFPMLGSPGWIVGLPVLAVNVLSGQQWMRRLVGYYAIIPLLFAYLAAAQTAGRLAAPKSAARRDATGLAVGLVVIAALLPALFLTSSPPVTHPSPPVREARAVLEIIPPSAQVYVPVALYPHLANRTHIACWESLREKGREHEMLGRYEWFVLWPDGDPPAEPHDAPLVDLLADDSRFSRMPSHSPFIVYWRR